MPISDYKPLTAEVTFKGGSLSVRGLVLEDVATLLRLHLTDLDKIIEMFESGPPTDLEYMEYAKYAVKIAREAPGLVANTIALACDDGDNVDDYRKLSMPIMITAIKAIAGLTFEEAGGPKKFFESLMEMIRGMRPPKTGLDT